MPCGLKNVRATYQRATTTLLHDMIHKEVKVYMDDMIVKSKDREGHYIALKKFFERIREHKQRLNPQNYTFGVYNNQVEYEACITELEVTLELGAIRLDMIGDLNLVISQSNGDWKVKEEKMKVYHQTLDMLILRYGVPNELISDNGSHFRGEVAVLLEKYNVAFHKSSTYRPQTNGVVKAANKNIKTILRKTVETYKDWLDKLPFALWAYMTSI
ncbi:uncharacterized protein LOC114278587 [Camellia sinensis]|uniref:uncharacterized protein LOC114278587 n=1 Tax=Camellia sinensis TaxID=4442 RepID=UPI0010356890|nr:uncharacterized protein LOC114278587 [Camellia sinensis]